METEWGLYVRLKCFPFSPVSSRQWGDRALWRLPGHLETIWQMAEVGIHEGTEVADLRGSRKDGKYGEGPGQ